MAEPAPTEETLRRQAYSAATTRFRNENRPAFDKILAEEMKKRGIDWSPKPTETERARAQVEEIFAAHPEIREELLG
jgi:hypothetical protein